MAARKAWRRMRRTRTGATATASKSGEYWASVRALFPRQFQGPISSWKLSAPASTKERPTLNP